MPGFLINKLNWQHYFAENRIFQQNCNVNLL
ncbi:hypothetical protein HNQ38_000725 [Desulfovibrio intestinalis]|uniref:Uncharacterized protein n=1 Tax=Desulfovibrio intestinalis TaxID=58621 RepID=A0A7W8BZ55_9BACT|nr:hypothetical protein [Desulfovibrio intestinalis]